MAYSTAPLAIFCAAQARVVRSGLDSASMPPAAEQAGIDNDARLALSDTFELTQISIIEQPASAHKYSLVSKVRSGLPPVARTHSIGIIQLSEVSHATTKDVFR